MVERIALNICCTILGSVRFHTRVHRVAVVHCSLCYGRLSVPFEQFDPHWTIHAILYWDFTKIFERTQV
jgi:hypothetical protein